MSAALALYGIQGRYEPGAVRSVVLSLAVHGVLFAALIVGVRWQSHPPEAVMVELWETPPAVMPQPEPPQPAPPPPPEPATKLEEPDIAQKVPAEAKPKPAPPRPRVEPEKKKKAPAKAKPKPVADEMHTKRVREELAREQETLRAQREEVQVRELVARGEAAARAKALVDYESKIRAKVRGNLVLPRDLEGNPEAIVDVAQLPDGTVISVKLRKSSGHKGYDEQLERAILKSSPLPKPDRADIFARELKLTFRPQER